MKNTYKFKTYYLTMITAFLLVLLAGCSQTEDVGAAESVVDDVLVIVSEETDTTDTTSIEAETTVSATSGTWSEETHSNDVDPNYDVVFNQDEVLEFHITIDPDEWAAMNTDLDENVTNIDTANAGGGGQGRGKRTDVAVGETADATTAVEGAVMPARPELAEGEEAPARPEMAEGEEAPARPELAEGEEAPARPEMIDGEEAPERPEMVEGTDPVATIESTEDDSDYEPIWVESTITFDGDIWENVGIRFKGNSSLTSVASSDVDKFSFKLDFDEFEDEYPEIDNQRFYGFKQLNLNSNFGDSTLLHEKVAADLFRDFGVVSANTSFCAVFVDYGEGEQYFGLYTIVEEIDDTVLEDQFTDDDGNLYKPDGDAASFAEGSFDEGEMEKKTNEDEADYSDVESLYTIINSGLRVSDTDAWQSDLEEVFDVDAFLKWLAVNQVIQNWDTYGTMTHNYYLYNNPDTGLLTWIPWDNNEALADAKKGGLSLGLTEVSDNWPLISYIIDVPEYKATYEAYMAQFIDEVFTEEAMTEIFDDSYTLIQSYAYAEEEGYSFIISDEAFDQAVADLYDYVTERIDLVESYLED